MKLVKSIGVLAFGSTLLHSQGACSLPMKKGFYESPAAQGLQTEPIRKTAVSSKERLVSCTLKDSRTVVYSTSKGKKTARLVMPLYEGSEKPLDISCSAKRTTVLTTSKIVVLPGYQGPDEVGISNNQELGKPSRRGIVAGEIHGDDVFVVTRDRTLWHTNINDPQKILSFRIEELKGTEISMHYYEGLLFIAHNAPGGKDFLVVVRLEQGSISALPFSYHRGEIPGKIRFRERNGNLGLELGADTYRITVGQEGTPGSVSLKAVQ